MDDLNRNEDRIVIRDARPDDAPFLAKCIMAGMHFYDFESGIPEEGDLFRRLTACERRDDLLYDKNHFASCEHIPTSGFIYQDSCSARRSFEFRTLGGFLRFGIHT